VSFASDGPVVKGFRFVGSKSFPFQAIHPSYPFHPTVRKQVYRAVGSKQETGKHLQNPSVRSGTIGIQYRRMKDDGGILSYVPRSRILVPVLLSNGFCLLPTVWHQATVGSKPEQGVDKAGIIFHQ